MAMLPLLFRSKRNRIVFGFLLCLIALSTLSLAYYLQSNRFSQASDADSLSHRLVGNSTNLSGSVLDSQSDGSQHEGKEVRISLDKQSKIGLEWSKVTKGMWNDVRTVPAKLELDPARHYAVTAPATLVIEELAAPLGSEVKQGDPLLTMSSPQITVLRGGLVRQQLLTDKARQSLQWHREIDNEVKLLVEELEKVLATPNYDWEPSPKKPIADFGAKILSAYARYRAAAQLSNIATRVIESGALAEKSIIERISEREATKALLRGEIEQSRFELRQAILSAESDLAAAEASLQSIQSDMRKYLGLRDWNAESLQSLDASQNPDHFVYRSPGNGTVLERYFANGERAEVGNELVLVADISSLWLVGELRQQDWDLLTLQKGDSVQAEVIGLESKGLQEATIALVAARSKKVLAVSVSPPTLPIQPGFSAQACLLDWFLPISVKRRLYQNQQSLRMMAWIISFARMRQTRNCFTFDQLSWRLEINKVWKYPMVQTKGP